MGDADAAYAADPLIHLGPRGHVGRIEVGYWYSPRELKDLTRRADADGGVPSVIELEAVACQHRIPDACVRPPGLCASSSRTESRTAMNSTDPPPKPTLYMNGTKDAHRAKRLLEQYGIDFVERHTPDPFVSLHWNGTTYTDLFGIADFLMFAGRLSLPRMRTRDGRDNGELPGSRIPLS